MIKSLKKNKIYIIVFILIETIIILQQYKAHQKKLDEYYTKKNNELKIAYSAILHDYETTATIIFNEMIKKPEVIDIFRYAGIADEKTQAEIRSKLHLQLKQTYDDISKLNFFQLHFQLTDGKSFLRFHRPDRFGDDLSLTRPSVKQVNLKKEPVQSFEIGSVYNGYRFIYPLFFNNLHIGNVEIGVPFYAIQNAMEDIFKEKFYFILKKSLVNKNLFEDEQKNYIISSLSDDYVISKNFQATSSKIETIDNINRRIKEENKNRIQKGYSFSINTIYKDTFYIVSLLSISNFADENNAYIISYTQDKAIDEFIRNFHERILLLSILFIAIISFIYYINLSRTIQREIKEHLEIIMNNIHEGILFLDLNYKIISVNPAAEKIMGQFSHELLGLKLDNVIDYESPKLLSIEMWPIFDNLSIGLDYKAKRGFFITREQSIIPIELTATLCYRDLKIIGYLIVFREI